MTDRRMMFYTQEDFVGLRAVGRLAAETLDMITPHVQEGVTTDELNQIIHDYTIDKGAIPAPLNYRGFPKSCCISINHVVCHGIPGDRKLKNGDIVISMLHLFLMDGLVTVAVCMSLARPHVWHND